MTDRMGDMSAHLETSASVGQAAVTGPAPVRHPPAGMPASDVLTKLGHELRSPLTGVIGLTRILLTTLNTGTAQQRRQLEMILATARRSLTTIDRVVAIAEIDSGRLSCDMRPIDGRVAIEATTAFQAQAEQRGLRLRTEFPDHPVMIMADEGILARLLHELLDNAVKFADKGDVLVRIRTDGGQHVEIEVSDDGPGIPAHDQDRIFTAFERGELATERDDDGAGLGLCLARELAGLLDARLSVRSRPGERTAFTLRFSDPGVRPETVRGTHPRSRT